MLTKHTLPSFSLNSGQSNSTKSSLGDSFIVKFGNNVISVPSGVQRCTISLIKSMVWYTQLNVTAANNKLTINTLSGPSTETITIQPGLYTFSWLADAISRELIAAGYVDGVTGGAIFTLSPDQATNSVILTMITDGYEIDFTASDSIGQVLGFNSLVALSAGEYQFGDTTARLNQFNYFHIFSDLVTSGVSIDGAVSNCIGIVPLEVSPGEQQWREPLHIIELDASSLIGSSVNSARVWITDELGNNLDMGNEDWSVELQVAYYTK